MSKNINVNPDHYKGAGRERQGQDIIQSAEREVFEQQQALNERWQARERGRARPTAEEKSERHPAGRKNA